MSLSLFFFFLHQSLVPFVTAVAEHLLSWPPFRWPADECMWKKTECVTHRERERNAERICLYVWVQDMSVCGDTGLCSCWGSPPDGYLLFPLSVSPALSLCPGRFMGLPLFSMHTATKFMSLDTSLSQGINQAG